MNSYIPIIFSALFIACTCCRDDKDCHEKITIINNSDKAIYFERSYRYPDTIPIDNGLISDPHVYKIEKFSSKKSVRRDCYEFVMQSTYPKIMYYIYDAATLETEPWDTVVKKYMILKRYDLSLEDLQRMNWTITYP